MPTWCSAGSRPGEAFMAQQPGKVHPVVDADSHVVEPPAIWDHYLDPEYRVLARSWFWREEGEVGPLTVLNGRPVPELPSPAIPRYGVWRPGMTPQDIGSLDPRRHHPINPGARDPQARLKDMDLMGVDQAILFPTFFGAYFPLIENPDVAYALARAYNDWILDFCRAAPDRLVPVAVLPLLEVNFAVREARRVAMAGFRAVMVRPMVNQGRYPAQPYYHPLWKELETQRLVACFHPAGWPVAELDGNAPFIDKVAGRIDPGYSWAEFIAPTMDNDNLLVAMAAEGHMEQFPGLRMEWAHSGIAWVLVTLEKAETYLTLRIQQDHPVCIEPEKLFFHRHNLVTFSAGDSTVRRMAATLENVAAWGSRYPNHDASSAGEAVRDLEEGGVSGATIEKLMGGNAIRVFGLR